MPSRRLPLRYLWLLVAPFVCACGCAGRGGGALDDSTKRPTSVAVHPPRSSVLATSVNGEPITLHLFGGGPDSTLILAGIHGDELSAVALGNRLLDTLRTDPTLPKRGTVAVIAAANPDAIAVRTRTNANGVDCNRNFPAVNWRPSAKGRFYTGPAPASEPETRAVMRAVELVRPRRIVSIHSPLRCNNFDGPGEELARLLASYNGYPVRATIGYPTPGSFGSWAGNDLGIAVVTLELPRRVGAEQAWRENGPGLLSVISGAGPAAAPATPVEHVPPRELLHDLPRRP